MFAFRVHAGATVSGHGRSSDCGWNDEAAQNEEQRQCGKAMEEMRCKLCFGALAYIL